jgi:hypothetical protein
MHGNTKVGQIASIVEILVIAPGSEYVQCLPEFIPPNSDGRQSLGRDAWGCSHDECEIVGGRNILTIF